MTELNKVGDPENEDNSLTTSNPASENEQKLPSEDETPLSEEVKDDSPNEEKSGKKPDTPAVDEKEKAEESVTGETPGEEISADQPDATSKPEKSVDNPAAEITPDEEISVEKADATAKSETSDEKPADVVTPEDKISSDKADPTAKPSSEEDDSIVDEEDDEHDEEDDETEAMISSDKTDDPESLMNLDARGLVELADQAKNMVSRDALRRVRDIRPLLNDALDNERKELLKLWTEAGKDPEHFIYDDGGLRNRFVQIFNAIKTARQEEKERIEKEQQDNLKIKEALLAELQAITEQDESEGSLNEVKEIQKKWRQIRVLPRDQVDELWKRYHYYLDKFYDNHSIFIELKDLDRKKNLEHKIELCKKVDELLSEKSLKKSFILLNKYTEEFKNTGPVPREFNEEIWTRFRAACDKIYEEKRGIFKELEEQRNQNLELKKVLVEKASLIAAEVYDRVKIWNRKTEEMDALFAEWKTIGPVPRKINQDIWKSFRSQFNEFYKNKSEYFKSLHSERKTNLELKEAICVKAESLMDSNDFPTATREMLQLQEEWKSIGPVHEKVSNAIWKRFRKACDHFFARKQDNFKHIKVEEQENLRKKTELIAKLEQLAAEDQDKEAAVKALQEIQGEWSKIGYVPRKNKKDLDKNYSEATNKLVRKTGIDRGEISTGQSVQHYQGIKILPNGIDRLHDEIKRINRKIHFLEGEVSTWENNIGFFAQSKTANKLKDEIESKIKRANEQISKLKAEIKAIRKVMQSDGQ